MVRDARHIWTGQARNRAVEMLEGALADLRRDLGTEPAEAVGLVDDERLARLRDRGQDRLEIERAKGPQVDDLGLDAVLASQRLGRLEGATVRM